MVTPEIQVSLPSKCFFLGEYAVLKNRPAILATFAPHFTCSANPAAGKKTIEDFYAIANSPAGLFWQSDAEFFSQWEIDFKDPFPKGVGGFGRSSAEFGALFSLRERAKKNNDSTKYEIAWQARTEYQKLLKDEKPVPSVADLVAQMVDVGSGSLLFLDFQDNLIQEINGYPEDVGFYIFPTGIKVPTHEHLANLPELADSFVDELTAITIKAQSTLTRTDRNPIESIERAVEVGELLDRYHILLAGEDLVHREAMDFRDKIRAITGVLGAKGCGALGADIVVAAVRSEEKSRFLYQLGKLPLHGCFDFRGQEWIKEVSL